MNILLFNTFKKRDPKSVIVFEKTKKRGIVEFKAHCLFPLPDCPSINPCMEFQLSSDESITIYLDTQSGVHRHQSSAHYEVKYPLEWDEDANLEIEFTPDPDDETDEDRRKIVKYKKNNDRKTAWNFKIHRNNGHEVLEGNHTVEVGDDDQ